MAISSAVEKEGTITLPKIIREKAHLERGRRITIDIDEEGDVIIKKVDDVKTVRGAWKEKEEILEAITSLKRYWDAWKP
ncbi:MAG: AbrB/MazE/SpoVT family DNA-binding domain-containing protein [Euryarchaeota archaeon]|nr:AbrB/MazE/SpoVT family DNA-binding domain-containing protein [Euryarchaeota archaeon]